MGATAASAVKGPATSAQQATAEHAQAVERERAPQRRRDVAASAAPASAAAIPADAPGGDGAARRRSAASPSAPHLAPHSVAHAPARAPESLRSLSTPLAGAIPLALPAAVRDVLSDPGRPLDHGAREAMQAHFARKTLAFGPAAPAELPALPAAIWISRPGNRSEIEAEQLAQADPVQAGTMHAESNGAPDFSRVRLHTDALAARATRALGTAAFAYGQHVVIDGSRYAPGTPSGARLLAHELAHTLQSSGSHVGVLMRDTPSAQADTAGTTPLANVAVSVTLNGLRFEFTNTVLKEGPPRLQVMAIVLRRLVGEQYKTGLEDRVFVELDKTQSTGIGLLDRSAKSQPGKYITDASLDLGSTISVLNILSAFGFRWNLTQEQVEILLKGIAVVGAWKEIGGDFPKWYTLAMFRREMGQHGELLDAWRTAQADKSPSGDANRDAALEKIEGPLLFGAMVLDAIRTDIALGNEALKPTDDMLVRRDRESAAAAYGLMFHVHPTPDKPVTDVPETVDEDIGGKFLVFLHTQEKLADGAIGDDAKQHDVRTQLLGRFGRFYVRASSKGGVDEQILKHPAKANAPAWSAVLSDTPALSPPLFAAALETDHAFTMQLQWQHWTDAWAVYSYMWEFIHVSDSLLGSPGADALQAAGEKPSASKVLNARLRRARRYNAADVERIHQELGNSPWGSDAEDLVHANNALRIVGTVVRFILDKITEPAYVARYVFPEAGLYIVRCRAVPVLEGDEELKRMPSISVLPVVVRDPDEMAVSEVNENKRSKFQAQLRLAEIQSLLASPFPPENADALRQEMKELQAMLLDPTEALKQRGETLDAQIAVLEKRLGLRQQIDAILSQPQEQRDAARLADLQRQLVAAGGESGNAFDEGRELDSLRDQRKSNAQMQTMEAERTQGETGLRFSPLVSFVSDLGQSLQLSIEMFDRGVQDGAYQVFMSDLTTPDSGKELGTAPETGPNPRVQAIKNGLKKLLEGSSDYGRGRVAIDIDGTVYFVRIEAGTGRMLTEAAENAATVATLAAIVAAPITDGASLFLLLPLGAVGAVTSAYRLYQRYDENRLRLDFAAVMDVVNIVGGVLGLAQVATPLRAVRMGKVLMVLGIGMDGAGIMMLGAGVMVQLDALQSLPEHERAARMLEILGGAMVQLGIQGAGAVMHARYQSHRSGAAGNAESGGIKDPVGGKEEPGFHAATPDELAAAQKNPPASGSDAGDRSMAGSGKPPADPPPAEKTPAGTPSSAPAAAKSKNSSERLLDRLEGGVDRSLPPPLPPEAVKKAPKAGEYLRGVMSEDAAYAAYNKALMVSAGREVAIYHNPSSGEYSIMVGSETGVRAPEQAGWNAVVHYHPNEGNVLTFRLPAPQDFRGLMMRYFAEGGAVREFIEFNVPGVGRGRTEYGIQPGHPEPFYVRINEADGTSRTLRFANDGHYSAYWGERTIAVPEGSPVYDAMIRDIQDYIRSIRGTEPDQFGPHEKTPAAPPGEAPASGEKSPAATPSPGDKSVAKGKAAKVDAPLQSGSGALTDEGVAFLRSKFKSVSEGNGKKVELASLSDADIKERFPNQPGWLEAIVVAQARGDWLGRTTKTDFVMANPTQNFRDVAAKLQVAIDAGQTGHTLHTAILDWNVVDFVGEMLRQNDPTLTPAYNACENHSNPEVRKKWQEFKTSSKAGDMSGFFLGKVGSKRPDIVEVMLSQNEIHITDASFAYADPIHNFKSAFYKAVMERMTTVGTVTSTDYRAPLLQKPM